MVSDYMGRIVGKQSIAFDEPAYIIEGASIVGEKEGEGPLGKQFDVVEQEATLSASPIVEHAPYKPKNGISNSRIPNVVAINCPSKSIMV